MKFKKPIIVSRKTGYKIPLSLTLSRKGGEEILFLEENFSFFPRLPGGSETIWNYAVNYVYWG